MHACGHAGHVAIGLEVARRLAPLALPGSVKFAFQPAEEVSNGAQAMIQDGVLEKPKVDAAFGIHLWNDLPVGTIGIMAGPVMASVDQFEIEILGRGGHAAAPHQTIDPVLVAAHVITALQSLVSRRRDPLAEAVVSVTEVHAGRAFNVIPDRADLRDRKSTRLNSSHGYISYAVFCLKKKKRDTTPPPAQRLPHSTRAQISTHRT